MIFSSLEKFMVEIIIIICSLILWYFTLWGASLSYNTLTCLGLTIPKKNDKLKHQLQDFWLRFELEQVCAGLHKKKKKKTDLILGWFQFNPNFNLSSEFNLLFHLLQFLVIDFFLFSKGIWIWKNLHLDREWIYHWIYLICISNMILKTLN